mmetsp:Transcript_29919/g.54485  ORF Transcript_29919/g.54485 Transcript_29919/m.54485 type:complete len:790 (-) Transcript_29919:54-2423(-)
MRRGPVDSAAGINPAALEGDGLADRLFELLWRRDSLSDASLTLRIPDTVIYRYNAPSTWYFTALDGTIKRKTKAKVTREHIADEFLKKENPSGIIAYYVSNTAAAAEEDAADGRAQSATKAVIEYFDRAGLLDFLFHSQKARADGILQRFIEPREDSNNMLRAIWSPKVCMVERRVNRLRVSDTKYDMYERAVTFEGPTYYSEIKPLRGATLATKAQDVADMIVQHVAAVSDDRMKIARLALNFKVDARERLWLLFASSIRLRQRRFSHSSKESAMVEADSDLQMPDHVRRGTTIWCKRPMVLQQGCRCTTCGEKADGNNLHTITYKVIIESEERLLGTSQRRHQDAASVVSTAASSARPKDDDNLDTPTTVSSSSSAISQVPPTVARLHPRMSYGEYMHFRNDVAFLCKSTEVCEECYLKFSRAGLGRQWFAPGEDIVKNDDIVTFKEKEQAEREALLGTQALDPSRLRRRQQATQQRINDQQVADKAREALSYRPPKLARAQSAPRLTTWMEGAIEAGDVHPVAPARHFAAPKPPTSQPPAHWYMRQPRRQEIENLEPKYLHKRDKVDPLIGAPYLRELQDFAVRCSSRAETVLPSSFAKAVAAASSPTRPRRAKGRVASEHATSTAVEAAKELERGSEKDEEVLQALDDIEEEESITHADAARRLSGKWHFHSEREDRPSSAATLTTRPPSASSQATRNASRPWSGCSSQLGGGSSCYRAPSSQARPMSSPSHRSSMVGKVAASTVFAAASDGISHSCSSPQLRGGAANAAKPPRPTSAQHVTSAT